MRRGREKDATNGAKGIATRSKDTTRGSWPYNGSHQERTSRPSVHVTSGGMQ